MYTVQLLPQNQPDSHLFWCFLNSFEIQSPFFISAFSFLHCYYSTVEYLPFLHFKLLWFRLWWDSCACLFLRFCVFSFLPYFIFSTSSRRNSNWLYFEFPSGELKKTRNHRRITEPNYTKAKTLEKYQLCTMESCDCSGPPPIYRAIFVYFFLLWFVGASYIFYISTLNNYMASVVPYCWSRCRCYSN